MIEAADWSRIPERGSQTGLRLLIGLYRIFGRPLGAVLTQVVSLYFFLVSPSVRAASRAYLRRVAGRPDGAAALGRPPGALASFLHVRAFALSIFDRMQLWLGAPGTFTFQVSGVEACQRLLRPDRGALVIGSHVGSFDALRALAERDDRVLNVLMFTRNAERINALFEQLAPESHVRVIQADPGSFGSSLQIRACIERGELVAMLGDRVGPNDRRTVRVSLLGGAVELPETPYLLAGVLGCPLFFMVALRSGPCRYRVFAEVLAERVWLPRSDRDEAIQDLAQRYAERLAHYCTLAPYEWFNFYDYWQEGAR